MNMWKTTFLVFMIGAVFLSFHFESEHTGLGGIG
jgi:hypothetical protein